MTINFTVKFYVDTEIPYFYTDENTTADITESIEVNDTNVVQSDSDPNA